MIKFRVQHPETGRIIFGYVLSERNIKLLKQGKPIHFNAEDFGLEEIKCKEVMIMYYATEEKAIKDLKEKGYIDKNTKIETPTRMGVH